MWIAAAFFQHRKHGTWVARQYGQIYYCDVPWCISAMDPGRAVSSKQTFVHVGVLATLGSLQPLIAMQKEIDHSAAKYIRTASCT